MGNYAVKPALDGKIEFMFGHEFENMRRHVVVHDREYLGLEGRLAVQLLERFGLVAAKEGGEDSSGRQAFALLPPVEAVERSITMAQLMAARLRERGLVAMMPSIAEAKSDAT